MAALINGGGKLTYDDYIDIQIRSSGKQRTWFKMCYYNIPCNFMGCIEKKAKKNICFKRIYVLKESMSTVCTLTVTVFLFPQLCIDISRPETEKS